jgi:ElaA protein
MLYGVPLHWVFRPFAALGVDALYALMRLRQEVFTVEQRCAYLDADGLDPQCWHLLGWASRGRLQACLRVVPPGLKFAEASIGRVAVAAGMRSHGLGHELVAKGVVRCTQLHPGQGIRIASQAHLQRFYERFGFRAEGATYLEDGIAHLDMLHDARQQAVRAEDRDGSMPPASTEGDEGTHAAARDEPGVQSGHRVGSVSMQDD